MSGRFATEIAIFVVAFVAVAAAGFGAARWQRGNLAELAEWSLGGRRFGTWVTWFLLGGDAYTAYTVIAVPAAVYGTGAAGFFAVPYTVMMFPLLYLWMPRLWNVCKAHGLATPADFVAVRHGNPALTLSIALTGILATMPYIALQLVGMQVVLASMGLGGGGLRGELPLALAFAILAAYTYKSGLRAPAMIAFVKDVMIYVVVGVAIVALPLSLGGFGNVFARVRAHFDALAATGAPHGALILPPANAWSYATLALGSALAVFMYPHTITGVLSARGADVIRRNAVLLPAYSIALGLIALLGFVAIAANLGTIAPTAALPALFQARFPAWFVGFAFAAIAVGALVPAAVMSIAAANLWTRNVWKPYLRRDATDAEETTCAKRCSLVVKLGALLFVVGLPTQYAINLQLLGGVWILQTLPTIVDGLYARRLHDRALLAGWAAGMIAGTELAFANGIKPTIALHVGGATIAPYLGLDALLVNLVVAGALSAIFARNGVPRGADATRPEDYDDGKPLPIAERGHDEPAPGIESLAAT